jgi:hypothetical protein
VPGAIAIAVLALGLSLGADAKDSGGRTGASVPGATKDVAGALTYDTFTNSSCSQGSFFTLALGHLTISGPVHFTGVGFLDGAKHTTYSEDLGSGPATFDTKFSRDFVVESPPPPPSSTYTYVFDSSVFQGGTFVGRSITTIRCTGGAFAATNVWTGIPAPIPANDHPGLVALAALLAVAGAARLRRARRART